MEYEENPDEIMLKRKDLDEQVPLSVLYPETTPEYFRDKPDALGKIEKPKSNVKPFIRHVDLNNTKEDPYANKPKGAWEIGIKWSF